MKPVPTHSASPPSIAQRMSRALAGWALVWGLALAAAAWLAVRHEMNELLDETLNVAARDMLAPLLAAQRVPQPVSSAAPTGVPHPNGAGPPNTSPATSVLGSGPPPGQQLMWQVVLHDGSNRVVRSSANAPAAALFPSPTQGYTDTPQWRIYGLPLEPPALWLYVSHAQDERTETLLELAAQLALATGPMALLALLWLRHRMRHELAPLQRLAQQLGQLDASPYGMRLGPPERNELSPVHQSVETLTARLETRMARERAFTAHAAHALRTPLAGIDAQLAVAVREATTEQQPRLQRTREAAARLQRVVAALLALFRSSAEPEQQALHVPDLLARTSVPGLQVHVDQCLPLVGDDDLIHAALLNLLDNAQRHGAQQVWVDTPAPQVLRLRDDGPGAPVARLAQLRAELETGQGLASGGLGLLLADLVARSHGGRLVLPVATQGFAVEVHLKPPTAAHSADDSPTIPLVRSP